MCSRALCHRTVHGLHGQEKRQPGCNIRLGSAVFAAWGEETQTQPARRQLGKVAVATARRAAATAAAILVPRDGTHSDVSVVQRGERSAMEGRGSPSAAHPVRVAAPASVPPNHLQIPVTFMHCDCAAALHSVAPCGMAMCTIIARRPQNKNGMDCTHLRLQKPSEWPGTPIRERLALIQIRFSGLWCLIRNKSARSALLFFENWE